MVCFTQKTIKFCMHILICMEVYMRCQKEWRQLKDLHLRTVTTSN